MATILRQLPIAVHLRHVPTGETRVYRTEEPEWEDGWSDFIWDEGNYSCDCNRWLFWERAAGRSPATDVPCSDGVYRVDRIVREDTGEVLYEEGSE